MTTWAWGANQTGQCGVGDTADHFVPTIVAAGVDSLKEMAQLILFVAGNGDVYLTGPTTLGVWSNGVDEGIISTPVRQTALSNIVKARITTGANALVLDNTGGLWGWGANTYGELGLGSTGQVASPVVLLSGVADFEGCSGQVVPDGVQSAGWVLALLMDGTLKATGYNGAGQFGQGDSTSSTSWRTLSYPAGTIAALGHGLARDDTGAGGHGYSLITMADGTSYGAGASPSGQLGISNGDAGPFQQTWLQLPFSNSVAVYGSYSATFSWQTDHTLWVIGENAWRLFGNASFGTGAITNTPVQVSLPVGVTVSDVGARGSQQSGKVLGSDGSMYMWGDNSVGQSGSGSSLPSQVVVPQVVPGIAPSWVGGGGATMFAGTLTRVTAKGRSFAQVIG